MPDRALRLFQQCAHNPKIAGNRLNASNARQGIKTHGDVYVAILGYQVGLNASNARQGIKTICRAADSKTPCSSLNASNARQGIKTLPGANRMAGPDSASSERLQCPTGH